MFEEKKGFHHAFPHSKVKMRLYRAASSVHSHPKCCKRNTQRTKNM